MKTLNNIFITLALIALALAGTACGGNESRPAVSGMTKMLCEESFQNIMDEEIEVFEYLYPKSHVMTDYVSESSALDSLMSGAVDLVITYRDLTSEQRAYLKGHSRAYRSRKLAIDGIAIIVNNANDIDELGMDDLKDIFTGKVKKWGEVYPTQLKNDSIKVVFDGNGTGALHYIQDKFNGGKALAINYFAQKNTLDVFKAVEAHKNVMGVVGVSWINSDLKGVQSTLVERVEALQTNNAPPENNFTDRIKVMSIRAEDQIKGVKPYQAYLYDGSYPLFRTIYAIDASPNGSPDHDFFVFITSAIGQKIILQTGIVPASVPVRTVELQ